MIRRAVSLAVAVPVLTAGALALSAGSAFAATTSLHADLSGANESKAGDASLKGTAEVTVDATSGQVCAKVTSNVSGAVAMHIHQGVAGKDGPVVLPLDAKTINGAQACVTASAALAKSIEANPAGFYVNIHTPKAPAGAVRGQLSAASTSAGSAGATGVAPSSVNAGSGGQAGTSGPDGALLVLIVAGVGLTGAASWRLARR